MIDKTEECVMIYTVTLNPAIDKTVEIPGFAAGTVNRVTALREDAGGKGINVSKCLRALGAESVAVVMLAGDAGDRLEELLRQEGLTILSAEIPGQTRTNLKIVDRDRGQNTDINEPGPAVPKTALRQLLIRLCQRIRPGDVVVLSGSLPQGAAKDTYRQWILRFQELGAKVLLDADGEILIEGVQAVPYLIKPNEQELSRLMRRPLETQGQLLGAGRELLAKGITNVVISMGGAGALFLWKEGFYRAQSLCVPVGSTVGAGDSVVAAMAYGLEKGLPMEKQIALAMAMGAASVMQSGTQAPDIKTVYRLMEQVEFEKLEKV